MGRERIGRSPARCWLADCASANDTTVDTLVEIAGCWLAFSSIVKTPSQDPATPPNKLVAYCRYIHDGNRRRGLLLYMCV